MRVPRGMEIEVGASAERSLRVASRDCSAHCSDDWRGWQVRFGLVTRGPDDHDCKFRVREVPQARKTVSLAGGVQATSLVVGDKSGSRDVGRPIPKGWTAGKATGGLRRAREDATRRTAMHSGKQGS